MYNNPFNTFNTYPQYNQIVNQQNYQRQEVVKVNGQNGAQAYNLPPNSSILMLDEQQPVVWLKTTDGAGYPTITPYKIEPFQAEKPVDVKSLEERIKAIEERLNESNTSNVKRTESDK